MSFLTRLTAEHRETTHPGRITNEKLLKVFDKYIRVDNMQDSSNFVINSRMQETNHFKIIPISAWNLLEEEFGGQKLLREKDT